MTTSNDASGAEKASDVSAAEPAVAEKKPRTRKSASPTKTSSPRKTAKSAAPAATDESAPAAESAEAAPKKAKAPAKSRRKAPAESAAETAPAEGEKAAAPKKAAGSRARKAAPKAEAAAAPEISPEAAPSTPASMDAAQPAAEAVAEAAKTAPRSGGSRRRRGSRGKGRSAAEAVKPEAAKSEAGEAQLALEAQRLQALPAGETLLAIDSQDSPIPLGEGEQHKKSRRRRRGKGGGSAESARGENAEARAAREDDAATDATDDYDDDDFEDAPEERSGARPARSARSSGKSKRKMFVNVMAGEQVEVVISEEGQLREYYVEMLHHAKIKGNIYKGVIHNVDPNLQAAFVSYGAAKNGFLQIDEVHPEYYLAPHEAGKGHKYPLIQKVLKAGQEILVQVVKEPSGTKGAFLTSYLSIPGRYLVLTPGREQIGVSRKVGNDSERSRLRELLNGLNPGPGLGVIVRTVSEGASKTNLQRDLQFLKRVWRDVRKKGSSEAAPALIYQELGLVARAVRDYLTEDVAELWVNDEAMAGEISEVITMLFPKRKDILQLHDDSNQSLFERFGLAKQIAQVQSREVVLPSGGRLVFDQTEALMAIDINSGRTGGKSNFEDMAFKINYEAAQHIPLQLRLRDIGGQVVVDFIEMRDRSHWREVEKAFRNGMKEDRARHDVGKISSFGLLEVVRQRLGSSAISIASEPCPFCKGTGIRRNMEWQAMQAMQEIQQLIRQNNEAGKTIMYSAGAELVLYLLNTKKEWLLDMEQENSVKLELHPGL